MPPQSRNLKEYGKESGVTAPQARNFVFFSHRSVEICVFLPFPIYQAPGVTFVWRFGGPNDSLGAFGGGGHGPFGPPWIRQWTSPIFAAVTVLTDRSGRLI